MLAEQDHPLYRLEVGGQKIPKGSKIWLLWLLTKYSSAETLIKKLEAEYQEVQKRSTGVYKRNSKGLSFLIGLLIAIALNADTFKMVSSLTKENNQASEQLITELEKNQDLFSHRSCS